MGETVCGQTEKVYCEDCKYYVGFGLCDQTILIVSTSVRRKAEMGYQCCDKNRENDCQDFKKKTKKWWQFWKDA